MADDDAANDPHCRPRCQPPARAAGSPADLKAVVMGLYLLFLLLPIYWLLNMSLKTNAEILARSRCGRTRPDAGQLRQRS